MFFVLDENHNLVEAYDKEGVLAVLAQAIADGSLSGITADSAFVSQLKCCVTGGTNKVAFVTQAKYNELKASNALLGNCMYYITDDTTADDIDATLATLTKFVNDVESGECIVQKARALSGMTSKGLDENTNYVTITEKGIYAVVLKVPDTTTVGTSIICIENLDAQFNGSMVDLYGSEIYGHAHYGYGHIGASGSGYSVLRVYKLAEL